MLDLAIVSLLRYLFWASMPKIDSLTRQLIPFVPTVLRPPRLRMALSINGLATLRHDSHNDSTATIPAAASSTSLANAPNYESADGVAYRGLTAFASLSMAVSRCVATFLAVASCSGFREAAKKTGLSQPAVTQHIKRLEQSLNASLIERKNDGCILTLQGREFLPFAEHLIQLSERAQALFRKNAIVIGASSNAGIYLLQPHLKMYQESSSREMKIVIGKNPDIADKLERLEIDVAVMEWWDNRPGYVAQFWRHEELVLIVPNDHRWADRQSIPREWLIGERLLGGESGTGTNRVLQQYFGNNAQSIGVSIQLGSTEAVKRAVQAGLGISLVMASAVELESREGRLKAIALENDPPKKEIFIIRRQTEPHHVPPAAEFASFLLKQECQI